MTITLDLKPEIEARLMAQAAAQGMSTEMFLQIIIERLLASSQAEPVSAILSPQERAKRFVNWAKSHSIAAPPLSDEAISRENIYTREDEMA